MPFAGRQAPADAVSTAPTSGDPEIWGADLMAGGSGSESCATASPAGTTSATMTSAAHRKPRRPVRRPFMMPFTRSPIQGPGADCKRARRAHRGAEVIVWTGNCDVADAIWTFV